jgi:transposase
VDAEGQVRVRKNLPRGKLAAFFGQLPPTEVVLEACGGSHHWGRLLQRLGHRVRLIPPQYVKPFVLRAKNDRNDAAAICEAAARPGIQPVPVKSAETQAALLVLRTRELLVGQRTQAVNALRGHAAEFGVVAAKGLAQVAPLLAAVAAADLPAPAPAMFALLGARISELDQQIAALESQLLALHKATPRSQRLAGIPGVGPLTAITLALTIDPARYASGRHLAAAIGLTPREHSTGGKQRMGGISRAGDERLRRLLVCGAMAVIRFAKPDLPGRGAKSAAAWLLALLGRKPRKLAAVALANKMARIAWAMMARGEAYRRPAPAAA